MDNQSQQSANPPFSKAQNLRQGPKNRRPPNQGKQRKKRKPNYDQTNKMPDQGKQSERQKSTQERQQPQEHESRSKQQAKQLSFKAKDQPGWSYLQQSAQENNMKNQPTINSTKLHNTFKADFVPRQKTIIDHVSTENIISDPIYGETIYDVGKIYQTFSKIALQLSSQHAMTQTFEQQNNMSTLMLASALMSLATQIQNSMTPQQIERDPFRCLMNNKNHTHHKFQEVIHTYGPFKSERGRTTIKYANLVVTQLYYMSLATIQNIQQQFLDMFKFEPSLQLRALMMPEAYANTIFNEFEFEKDEYVLTKSRMYWEKLSQTGFFDGQIGPESYLPYVKLATSGGRQWAMLHQEPTAVAICLLIANIQRRTNYNGLLNRIGLNSSQFRAVEIIDEVKKVKNLLNLALQKQQNPKLVEFQPLHIDHVQGRWQQIFATKNENQMQSNFIVSKEDVQYAFIQGSVERFLQGKPMTLVQSRPQEHMEDKGYSQDLKTR